MKFLKRYLIGTNLTPLDLNSSALPICLLPKEKKIKP